MKTRNPWIRHLRFKLLAVLCVSLLGQGLFIRPALATNYPSERDRTFSVISRGAGLLDLFVVDSCNILMKSWTGSNWTGWRNLGRAANGDCFFTVSAVAAGNNRWDIFSTVGVAGNTVWHKAFDGFVEYGWESRGNVGTGSPYGVQAVSTGNGRIDLFNRSTCSSAGCGVAMWKSRSATGVWSPCDTCNWAQLDTTASDTSITALAHSGNRIDLFRRSNSSSVIGRKYFNGTSWGPVNPFTKLSFNMWQDTGGLGTETPYAVSWGTNRIDVFVRGTDNNVYINNTDNAGSSWYGWGFLGRGNTQINSLFSAISAVAWGSNRLDLFTTENFTVYYKAWTGTNWWPSQTDWQNLGDMINEFNCPPLPVSWGPNRIDLFKYEKINSTSTLKRLYHKWTNGNGWGPSQTDWENMGPN